MTNEELVNKIQLGQAEYITQLWQQVVKFIEMRAGQHLDHWQEHYKVLREDMINESYFAFLTAIEKYDPEKGSFLNLLSWHIRPAFETVLQGRGNRLKNEPLNRAISIDTPVSDTEDITLADTLLDEESEAYYRRLEDDDFWNSVNRFLDNAIYHIKDTIGGELVRYMFDNNCSVGAASKALYGDVPVQYDRYKKAVRQLGNYMKYTSSKRQMELIGLDDYISYYGNGLQSYKNNLFTSAVERAAIRRADIDLRLKDMADVAL